MLANIFTLAVLSTAVVGSEFYRPVHYDFGVMLKRGAAIAKRQGYYPTTEPCGSGDTCEEACGAGQVECPSDFGLVCYDPTVSHCCTDGSGYSCDNGYYCTTDGAAGNTYCCPDGLDLASCAEAYSLTVSLIKESSTPVVPSSTAAPATETTPSAVYVPASTTALIHVSYPTATATIIPSGNGSYTTSAPPEFTGGAAKVAGAGMAVLAGAIAGLL